MPNSRRPSSRTAILEAATGLLREGTNPSLEAAARAAGLTKPGLMYHFPTKEALMVGLVDHLLDRYEEALGRRLPQGSPSVEERLAAYVEWSFTTDIGEVDLVMFADPRLRDLLTARYAERMDRWVAIPDDVPAERRARLLAARLIADGSWFADASGVLPLTTRERPAVLAIARGLLADPA